MHFPLPITREIVLIGGGHTHALVLRMWGMNRLAGARLTVIAPDPAAAYSGMLPGFVAGHYPRQALELDLFRLARFAGARLVQGRAVALDPRAREVTLQSGRTLSYDLASIDIGITSDMPQMPGFADHAVPAKPLEVFAGRWDAFRNSARGKRCETAVIGGGVAGIELAMAMAHGLRTAGAEAAQVRVLEQGKALSLLRDGTRAALLRACAAQGVEVIEDVTVTEVLPHGIALAGGREIASGFTVGAAGTVPHDWLKGTGLTLEDGFISVGPTLQSVSHETVFAAGDCAHLSHAPRPKAGVYAVREAPVLFHNLRAALMGKRLGHYRPQRDYLKLISLGEKRALADRSGIRFGGAWAWRWKDRIDRKFMDRLTTLDPMAPPPLPALRAEGVDEALAGRKPTCGGCGSKIGAHALEDALSRLPAPARPETQRAAGDDAALLNHGGQTQVLSVDQLRPLIDDPRVMAEITAVHALGDVWAMGAAPEGVLAAITLPPLSERLQSVWLAEIMAGIADVAGAAGADVLGGHTATGAELAIGLTVTGLTDRAIGLAGAKAGDALILTKPLGTGTVMAADMALAGRGDWTAAAIASMRAPQAEASRILAAHAHAMTDVTGFGLIGHLTNICNASGVGARLQRGAVPLLPGALELAEQGIASTLAPANRAYAMRVAALDNGARDALLIDPQTAGGLLAAVPRAQVAPLLHELHALGLPAADIGEIMAGPPWIDLE